MPCNILLSGCTNWRCKCIWDHAFKYDVQVLSPILISIFLHNLLWQFCSCSHMVSLIELHSLQNPFTENHSTIAEKWPAMVPLYFFWPHFICSGTPTFATFPFSMTWKRSSASRLIHLIITIVHVSFSNYQSIVYFSTESYSDMASRSFRRRG